MTHHAAVGFLFAAGLAGSPVWALDAETEKPGTTDALFDELDVDGNGTLSREEAARHEPLNTHFIYADSNQDGRLDRAEFKAFEEVTDSISGPRRGNNSL